MVGHTVIHNFLSGKALQSASLGFGNKQSCKDAAKHEECEDLHDMVEPRAVGSSLWSTFVDEGPKHALCDDCTDLASRGTDAVGGGTVPGREAFPRHNKGGRVGTEVEEELCEHVEGEQTIVRVLQRVIGKTDDDE